MREPLRGLPLVADGTDMTGDPIPRQGLDLDSVCALVFMGPRYLIQHREDLPDISYPNCWGLFGGACEVAESAIEALRREFLEELGIDLPRSEPLLTCTYDLWFEDRRTRKAFFAVELFSEEADRLVLGEGQGMAWLSFDEVLARAGQFVPYDLGVIALHHRGIRWRQRPEHPVPAESP